MDDIRECTSWGQFGENLSSYTSIPSLPRLWIRSGVCCMPERRRADPPKRSGWVSDLDSYSLYRCISAWSLHWDWSGALFLPSPRFGETDRSGQGSEEGQRKTFAKNSEI